MFQLEFQDQFLQKYGISLTPIQVASQDDTPLTEHFDEFAERLISCLTLFTLTAVCCFLDINEIVKLFQAPAVGIKFLQFAPGEYFFASIKIALFAGLIISCPWSTYLTLLYIVPGLKRGENFLFLPLVIGSSILFVVGLNFSYAYLIPAALMFFINYGSDVVEPFWSFDQYFNSVSMLLFSTALAFQLPTVQFILGYFGILSGKTMLEAWKYVLVISTIVSAFLTPSTDPITQILMAGALFLLYLGGAGLVYLLNLREKAL